MRLALAASLAALSLGAPALARADVPPPDECAGKKEGEACKDFDGRPGACGTITYTRTLPPSVPGTPPNTSERSHFGCKAGAKLMVSSGKFRPHSPNQCPVSIQV